MLFDVRLSRYLVIVAVAISYSIPAAAQAPKPRNPLYVNRRYDFCFSLPKDWDGFSILSSTWSGDFRNSKGDVISTKRGPIITIRHPKWTDYEPWQDIPIMVFTRQQWKLVLRCDLIVSAAPISPQEIGHNAKYVFALPPRYTSMTADEAKETWDVVKWIANKPLHTPCARNTN